MKNYVYPILYVTGFTLAFLVLLRVVSSLLPGLGIQGLSTNTFVIFAVAMTFSFIYSSWSNRRRAREPKKLEAHLTV